MQQIRKHPHWRVLLGFPRRPPLVPAAATTPTSYSNNSNAAASYGAGLIGETAGTGA